MSPRPAAPRSASMSACAITSPSEWPARPRSNSTSTPPSTRGTPSTSLCASAPIPTLMPLPSSALRIDRWFQTDARAKLARPGVGIASDSSSERLLAAFAPVEDGDGLVADVPRKCGSAIDVAADVLRPVGVGGKCDRHAALVAEAEQLPVGIELADRLVAAGRGDFGADARGLDRVGGFSVQVARFLVRRSHAEELDQIRVRERVEEAASSGVPDPGEVAAPRLADRQPVHKPGLLIDREAVDEVHRAEHVVPRVRLEQLGEPALRAREVVGLEPELDRQPAPLGLENRVDVLVEVVAAAIEHPRDVPEVARLAEVVDVIAEPDL